ncbi:hypothetical protein D5R81_10885 [Parashewanella spongiae]|uniref:Uncharacterized protein n=1 Tax=Parashewanella spongiae TaxID=342950 RepID=A0A3A6TSX2_9GAMM|nr:hypothetical protein [Parashewanella spongiae]MCL1078502.1 hypothetical protein [Parashewanella spongiae]RJY14705.1 hypothetical protein D5R81_10885 [Parashewanella spongiae]
MAKHSLTCEPSAQLQVSKSWRNPYRGMIRLWCFDIGSASFLITALLAAVFSFMALVTDVPKIFSLLYGMSIISVFAATSWMINRMRGNESIRLIPHLFSNLLIQACTISLLQIALGTAISWKFFDMSILAHLLVVTAIGLSFVRLCLLIPKLFFAAGFLFVIPAFFGDSEISVSIHWLALGNLVILAELVRGLIMVKWSPNAQGIYTSGAEMGMFSVPNIGGKWLQKVHKYLHPAGFFMGNALSVLLVLLMIAFVVLEAANQIFHWQFPTLALLSQMFIITCALVHWTRVQRHKAFELLYLLPTHSGLSELISQFIRGQRRLLLIVTMCIALFSSVMSVWIPELSKIDIIHITMSTYIGSALVLGLGCMCQKIWQVSLSMLVIVGQSLWLSMGVKQMSDGGDESFWLIGNVILFVIAEVIFSMGKRQLWKTKK